ncbi:hypothetical protein ACIBJI_40645 [Nocardia sp. NPDC050408]|uniref:hypothetical protein n=1 Tax=Nocardia sp. NPDC050408 TaxID=3364319 RepID=UPI0037B0252B
MTSGPSKSFPPGEDALKILLGWYASERSDGASLMSAGFTQVTGMLAYVGVVTTLIGKSPVPTPLVIVAAPLPALLLLVFYTVHSFNQGLRATSVRTLEQLIYPGLDDYVSSQPLPASHKALQASKFHRNMDVDLRKVAIGLHATELFYNAGHANRWHASLLNLYYALAALLVLGFTGIVDAVGIYAAFGQSVAHDWRYIQWALLWTEFGLGIAMFVFFLCFCASGMRHRNRAEDAAREVIAKAGKTPPKQDPATPASEPVLPPAIQQIPETSPVRRSNRRARWRILTLRLRNLLSSMNSLQTKGLTEVARSTYSPDHPK